MQSAQNSILRPPVGVKHRGSTGRSEALRRDQSCQAEALGAVDLLLSCPLDWRHVAAKLVASSARAQTRAEPGK